MPIESSPVAAPDISIPAAALRPSSSEERWEAWQARGVAADRAARRKQATAILTGILLAAAILYVLAIS